MKTESELKERINENMKLMEKGHLYLEDEIKKLIDKSSHTKEYQGRLKEVMEKGSKAMLVTYSKRIEEENINSPPVNRNFKETLRKNFISELRK